MMLEFELESWDPLHKRQQLPTFVFDKKKAQKRNLSASVCVRTIGSECVCDNPQSTASTPSAMSAGFGTVKHA